MTTDKDRRCQELTGTAAVGALTRGLGLGLGLGLGTPLADLAGRAGAGRCGCRTAFGDAAFGEAAFGEATARV